MFAYSHNFAPMYEDTIFMSLEFGMYDVTKEDIKIFLEAVDGSNMPDSFYFETEEGWFKINRPRREFRILKRKEYLRSDKNFECDFTIMAMYKVAKRSGYKCYLENKYMN